MCVAKSWQKESFQENVKANFLADVFNLGSSYSVDSLEHSTVDCISDHL